jgi:hypothetical protein
MMIFEFSRDVSKENPALQKKMNNSTSTKGEHQRRQKK